MSADSAFVQVTLFEASRPFIDLTPELAAQFSHDHRGARIRYRSENMKEPEEGTFLRIFTETGVSVPTGGLGTAYTVEIELDNCAHAVPTYFLAQFEVLGPARTRCIICSVWAEDGDLIEREPDGAKVHLEKCTD